MHDHEWSNQDERGLEPRSSAISPALIAWAVAAILAIAFILQNRSETEIEVLFWTFTTSVWVAIVIAMGLGAVLGWLGLKMWRRRRQ